MTPPNFLIVQADQLTSQVLSAYGSPLAKTPHMDRLAAEGCVFRNAYCSFPLCGPSRMSMMSGRLASRIGAYDNASEFRSEIPTFAHYLRARGYRTTLTGKMHFVGADQLHGFEDRLTTDIYPSDFFWTENLENRDAGNKSNARMLSECGVCDRSVQMDYDELAVFKAEQHLWDLARQRESRPFCLFVSLTHPHDPFYCSQEHFDRYADDEVPPPKVARPPSQATDPLSRFLLERHDLEHDFDPKLVRKARRAYLGSVSYVDDMLGRLLRVIERTGARDDTVVVVIGDHGEMLGERGLWLKRLFYEWSAAVPMIFWAPGRIAQGARRENVTLMDLLPTMLSLSGDDALASLVEPIDGRDLGPALRGDAAGFDNVALSEVMSDGLSAPAVMLRRDDWKLIWGPEHPAQLYDLASDPDETNDLGAAHGEAATVRDPLIAEAQSIWDVNAIQADIDLSIARRLLIRRAHENGAAPRWDYAPPPDDDRRWCRAGANYSDWSMDVLNPR